MDNSILKLKSNGFVKIESALNFNYCDKLIKVIESGYQVCRSIQIKNVNKANITPPRL